MPAQKTPSKSDGYTRKRQAEKWVRLIKVHRFTWRIEREVPDAVILDLAKTFNVSARTIYRDLQTLRMAYQEIGSKNFNP